MLMRLLAGLSRTSANVHTLTSRCRTGLTQIKDGAREKSHLRVLEKTRDNNILLPAG